MDSTNASSRFRAFLSMACILSTAAAALTMAGAASVYHSLHTSSPITFRMSTVDDNSQLGTSGMIGQDIDEDGYLDLVSFAYSGTTAGDDPGEIYWYQYSSPSANWTRRLIAKKSHPVHGDFIDVDGDGYQDLVFFSNFNVPIQNETTEGDVWWARQPPDLDHQAPDVGWNVSWIGRTLGAHRVVAVPDLDGSGAAWGVVVVPLVNPGPPPTYGPAPVTLYVPPPSDPTLPWTKSVSSEQFHVCHDGIRPAGSDGTILLACAEGIQQLTFRQPPESAVWELVLATVHPPPTDPEEDLITPPRDVGFSRLGLLNPAWNLSGVTSLAVSPPSNHSGTFLAAIDYTNQSGYLSDEPWHGDVVSLYELETTSGGAPTLQRRVLERRDAGGHHVQVADFNGDGCPDVAAGFRAYPTSLMLYLCVPPEYSGSSSVRYEKQIISERAAQQLVVHDWNRDGLPDIATCGDGNNGDPYIMLWTNQGRGLNTSPFNNSSPRLPMSPFHLEQGAPLVCKE